MAAVDSPEMGQFTSYEQRVKARKMMMWLGIVGMIMLFATLTSAYIVAAGGPGWIEVPVPNGFYMSTIFIVLSSGAVWFATNAVKNNNHMGITAGLGIALLLGAGFVVSQLSSWNELVANGFYFTGGSAASSYLYMISGVHLAHMVAGILSLGVTTFRAVGQNYTSERKLGLELAAIFWHFLGVLWVYLLLFLLFIR